MAGPAKRGNTRRNYCADLQLELDANNWLERALLARLKTGDRKSDAEAAARTLVRGRLFRPALSHLYLLRYGPFQTGAFSKEFVAQICEDTGSDFIVAQHYYVNRGGERLPRPLIRNVLRKAVSNGSADGIITALSTLGLATLVPCDSGRNTMAIEFHQDLFRIIESWMLMKSGEEDGR